MLKLHSTQFACALLFGPMGLAYISMASAVMLTLLTVVLYFTLLGPVVVVAMWPLAIVIGALAVHLHNSQLRNIGMSLLGDGPRFSALGPALVSGARAMAVLVLLGGAVFATYRFGPSMAGKAVDTVASLADKSGVATLFESEPAEQLASRESAVVRSAEDAPARVAASATATAQDGLPPVPAAAPQETPVVELPAVATRAKSVQKPTVRKAREVPLKRMPDRERFVSQAVANLRDGPGTQHDIVDIARNGDRLVQFERQGNWVHVRLPDTGRTAWIFGGLLKP